MKNRLMREILECCSRSTDLARLQFELCKILDRYDVAERTTDIVPYQEQVPKELKMYLVSRTIEGMTDSTAKQKYNILHRFFSEMAKPLREIDANEIRLWLYRQKAERNISNRTLDTIRIHLNAFFEWCVSNNILDRNPMRSIARIQYEKKPYGHLTQEDLETLRAACASNREHLIVEMYYSTGMRCTELSTVKMQDINFDSGTVTVANKKGKRVKTCYLNAKAIYWLKRYLTDRKGQNDFLIQNVRAPFGGVCTSSLERIVSLIVQRSGLGKHCTPMTFRHTCATQGIQSGMSLQEVQRMLDHKNPATTLIYAEMSDRTLQESHRKAIV